MTAVINVNGYGLERAFDVLLDQSQRIQKENELLRQELMRHASGALQIRSVERALCMAYRENDHESQSTQISD
jgi:hypothetical protein